MPCMLLCEIDSSSDKSHDGGTNLVRCKKYHVCKHLVNDSVSDENHDSGTSLVRCKNTMYVNIL